MKDNRVAVVDASGDVMTAVRRSWPQAANTRKMRLGMGERIYTLPSSSFLYSSYLRLGDIECLKE